jgi:hypothetical protein
VGAEQRGYDGGKKKVKGRKAALAGRDDGSHALDAFVIVAYSTNSSRTYRILLLRRSWAWAMPNFLELRHDEIRIAPLRSSRTAGDGHSYQRVFMRPRSRSRGNTMGADTPCLGEQPLGKKPLDPKGGTR